MENIHPIIGIALIIAIFIGSLILMALFIKFLSWFFDWAVKF